MRARILIPTIYRIFFSLFFLVMITTLNGCSFLPKNRNSMAKKDALAEIKRIAVFPFYNLSDRIDAEVLATNIFIGEILKTKRYSVIKYGDIRNFLLKQRIRSTETISYETMQSLASTLSVDAVMLGTINDYREWAPNAQKPSLVDISARIVDCASGRIIWFSRDKRTGWDGRKIFDIGEEIFCSRLVQKIAQNFLSEIAK